MPQCLKCSANFDNYIKINGDWKYVGGRKYCTTCTPYKSHNTKQIHLIPFVDGVRFKVCPKCKEEKVITDFYAQNVKSGRIKYSYCKKCCNKLTLARQVNLKVKAVEYKGGKCFLCGYNKYYGALDFHHVDHTKKEIQISKINRRKFDFIKKELDKCICVCKNCHAEIHAGVIKIDIDTISKIQNQGIVAQLVAAPPS